MKDLEGIGGPLRHALRRLGLTDVEQFMRLANHWDDVAGPPWAGATQPLMLQDGQLIVEAAQLAAVRMLRYATGDLQRRLDDFLGVGEVKTIRVIGPA